MDWLLKFSVCSFLLITFSATPLANKSTFSYVVIWNVGQGQWVTAVENFKCRHFDVGGERFPWKKVSALCRDKQNEIYLSHWDWDHIGALARWPKSWQSCIALRPQGLSSPGKMKMLSRFQDCATKTSLPVWRHSDFSIMLSNDDIEKTESSKTKRKRRKPAASQLLTSKPANKVGSNELSQVIRFGDFLFPGDSPVSAEKSWSQMPWVSSARILVLGHHGSRTSTSEELLERIPDLKLAISSARYERYKHPHPEVLYRLKRHHIPILKTEDWGNIWFQN